MAAISTVLHLTSKGGHYKINKNVYFNFFLNKLCSHNIVFPTHTHRNTHMQVWFSNAMLYYWYEMMHPLLCGCLQADLAVPQHRTSASRAGCCFSTSTHSSYHSSSSSCRSLPPQPPPPLSRTWTLMTPSQWSMEQSSWTTPSTAVQPTPDSSRMLLTMNKCMKKCWISLWAR